MELLLSYADSCFSSDKSKRSLDNQLFAKFGLYADERQRIRTADLGAVLDDFFLEPLSKAEIEQYANRLSSHAARSKHPTGAAKKELSFDEVEYIFDSCISAGRQLDGAVRARDEGGFFKCF